MSGSEWLIQVDGPTGSPAWLRVQQLAHARTGSGREVVPWLLVTDRRSLGRAVACRTAGVLVVASPPVGPSLLRAIARACAMRQLRAAVLTPHDAVATRLSALALGLDDAIPDSVSPEELIGRLRLLERPRPGTMPRPARTAIGRGIEVDLLAKELRRDGRPVHLRPREYRLLEAFVHFPEVAMSRRRLLDLAWDGDTTATPRTIDVHVRWLRSKIEPDPARPRHLVTVRGVGYRLDRDEIPDPRSTRAP